MSLNDLGNWFVELSQGILADFRLKLKYVSFQCLESWLPFNVYGSVPRAMIQENVEENPPESNPKI